jgi:hypothetical protein
LAVVKNLRRTEALNREKGSHGKKGRASLPDKKNNTPPHTHFGTLSRNCANSIHELFLRHSLAIHFPNRGAAPAATAHAPRHNPASYFLPIEFSRRKASGAAAIAAALRKCLVVKLASENSGVRNKKEGVHDDQ